MFTVFYLIAFFFGAAIGSFVHVVITRLHVAPIVSARSRCLSCGEALRAYDMIPALSYLLLRGKCRYCGTSYGYGSFVTEVLYGILFVLLYHTVLIGQPTLVVATLWALYYTLLFVLLGVIALYDRAHTFLPVPQVLAYCVLTLLMLCVRYVHEPSYALLLSPILTALPFFVLWVITRGKGLGFGDVVLFLGVGAFFPLEQALAVLLLSVWMGAIYGIGIYFFSRTKHSKHLAIPFVPFIVLAFLIVLFTDISLFSIASLFA
ncbi:MAG: prepilin peptidase [Candidatus Moraniibacteriota bacterium]|nr:MAG: prepilin peptidase [Candidatus Moranbacteria bacterium]